MKRLEEFSDGRLEKLHRLDDIQSAVLQRIHDRQAERAPERTEQERNVSPEPDRKIDGKRLLDVVVPGLVITSKADKIDFTIVSINGKITTLEDPDGSKRNVMTKHLSRDFFIN